MSLTDLWRLLFAILTVYRLAHLLPEDDGPFFVFKRLRAFTDRRRKEEQERTRQRLGLAEDDILIDSADLGTWACLDEGVRCPYCVGFWAALLITALVLWPTLLGDALMLWQGLAGAQSLLEKLSDR